MIYVYVVRDTVADAFNVPMFFPNNAFALRSLKDCVNSGEHNYSKHPEDYVLYRIGTFDDQTGQITGLDHEMVVRCSDLVQDYNEYPIGGV